MFSEMEGGYSCPHSFHDAQNKSPAPISISFVDTNLFPSAQSAIVVSPSRGRIEPKPFAFSAPLRLKITSTLFTYYLTAHIPLPLLRSQCRVEQVAQGVGQMVERQHQRENRKRHECHLPPHALPEAQPRVVDHDPPRRLPLHADAEKADEHFGGH